MSKHTVNSKNTDKVTYVQIFQNASKNQIICFLIYQKKILYYI